MNGLHLIADLYRCADAGKLMCECADLESLCVAECREAGLTPLGAYFYQFRDENTGEAAGVTGTVVLAESHLAIHTWPESGDVTLDVYVCNYSRDNSDRARRVFERVIAAMGPEDRVEHQVVRGRLPAEV
ncbi:MAG: S-adenosylmethionine decarboxylase proenzyme [Betaproteobacteria bacterium HGW-Betaproteobacteria-13]|jgi:spermidine synthase|uniref:S-adenosylmethionine decarboxylase family protein n=1 Tax=Parazoarcus communis TaxID=41977 RepID=UPI000CBEE405|nr:S-adenosylmethionine decarboxylase [Parazoarcus communis]PKO56340.1 MAG: S-adenosylmethionine decarboxylase proenzyme [Betaproteobacteria bacterium HGW-Betaproteobacteria-21]PKO82594.1 MAG: S-adenosylmethionine decarboxylase proenzyme [Betaproteobacteria bacterium HGW-Betaproteobacteria-13]|tara:strand:- start:202537 stop:202926 length:390 start_codon:yes stop_codon:yes gene_type:complete